MLWIYGLQIEVGLIIKECVVDVSGVVRSKAVIIYEVADGGNSNLHFTWIRTENLLGRWVPMDF